MNKKWVINLFLTAAVFIFLAPISYATAPIPWHCYMDYRVEFSLQLDEGGEAYFRSTFAGNPVGTDPAAIRLFIDGNISEAKLGWALQLLLSQSGITIEQLREDVYNFIMGPPPYEDPSTFYMRYFPGWCIDLEKRIKLDHWFDCNPSLPTIIERTINWVPDPPEEPDDDPNTPNFWDPVTANLAVYCPKPENLVKVNWLLNLYRARLFHQIPDPFGYGIAEAEWQDVQAAIWILLDEYPDPYAVKPKDRGYIAWNPNIAEELAAYINSLSYMNNLTFLDFDVVCIVVYLAGETAFHEQQPTLVELPATLYFILIALELI